MATRSKAFGRKIVAGVPAVKRMCGVKGEF